MTKVAIKNENITSFGGIYHIMDIFPKLGLGELIESVLGRLGSSGKAFSHGDVVSSLSATFELESYPHVQFSFTGKSVAESL